MGFRMRLIPLGLSLSAVLLTLPAFAEGDALQEAGALAAQGKAAFEKAHEMTPSADRNAILVEARKVLKHAIAKYQLLQTMAPDRSKEFSAIITDLQGLSFWCAKSIAIITPPSTTPPPVIPPPPEVPPEHPPGQPEPPPAPVAKPKPPQSLTETEGKQAAVLFGTLKELCGKMETAQDIATHRREAIRDIYATLESMRAGFGGGSWNQTKDFESLHDQLLEDAQKNQKKVQEALRNVQKLEGQIRGARSKVERWGLPGVEALAAWAKGKTDLPEDLLIYLNAQLAAPRFAFTAVPSVSPLPAESDPGAKAGETRALLDDLARQVSRDDALAANLIQGEVEREQLEGAIKDLDAHWEWRTKSFAWSMDHLKLKEQRKKEARDAITQSQASTQKAVKERDALAGTIDSLLAKLAALEPARVRAVEAWRLKQPLLPARVEEAVEAWTRKVLGQ